MFGLFNYSLFSASKVIVLAATNLPGALDKAFVRPGRFGKVLYVGRQDLKSRIAMIRYIIEEKSTNVKVTNDTIQFMAQSSDGLTGAEIELFCSRCIDTAILENSVELSKDTVKSALV